MRSVEKPVRKDVASFKENVPLVIFRKKQSSESLQGNSYRLLGESKGFEMLSLCLVSLTAESQLHITGGASEEEFEIRNWGTAHFYFCFNPLKLLIHVHPPP